MIMNVDVLQGSTGFATREWHKHEANKVMAGLAVEGYLKKRGKSSGEGKVKYLG